jgi:hypothetical protein
MAVAMLWIAGASAPRGWAAEEEAPIFDGAQAVQLLESERGGAQTTTIVESNTLHGTVTDNSASNLTTGQNVIGGGAFTNMQGLPMVIQNSGNNTLIQNTTIMNVEMK